MKFLKKLNMKKLKLLQEMIITSYKVDRGPCFEFFVAQARDKARSCGDYGAEVDVQFFEEIFRIIQLEINNLLCFRSSLYKIGKLCDVVDL
ncbi:hypothetical protein CEXT_752801 [Caerostris extrusa]|uniref:Uncharacterized protein n=1 Tax=Caerostris extrusa TaxID=172846 RepID=A0AAV4TDL8_CAEEX|nr:hypothetical protein CEXT_752801 [Caerostris extrusa]